MKASEHHHRPKPRPQNNELQRTRPAATRWSLAAELSVMRITADWWSEGGAMDRPSTGNIHRQRKRTSLMKADVDRFDGFVFEMSEVLDTFTQEADQVGFRLDYSLDSLTTLERYLLECLSTVDGPSTLMKNRAARYLGEVFRRTYGGTWKLCDGGPKYLFHGLPVIAEYARVDVEFCPIEMIANVIRCAEPGSLLKVVESHREWLRG